MSRRRLLSSCGDDQDHASADDPDRDRHEREDAAWRDELAGIEARPFRLARIRRMLLERRELVISLTIH